MRVNGSNGVFFPSRARGWRATCIALAFAVASCLVPAPATRAADAKWTSAVFPSGASFSLEIAEDPETRARGYMFREHVGGGEGMLFVFESRGFWDFWMKNCRVPLDLIWLDDKWRVTFIAHDQPPCPEEGECPSVAPMGISRYVLELAGGTARAQNLEPGDSIVVLSEPPLP